MKINTNYGKKVLNNPEEISVQGKAKNYSKLKVLKKSQIKPNIKVKQIK